MYGGMTVAIVLVIFSPAVSGAKTSMLPNADFAFFPLANPGIVSIPLSFLLGALGSYYGRRDPGDAQRHAEMEVRALTGAGAAGSQSRPEPAPPSPSPSQFLPQPSARPRSRP
jgi:cation/acetate symporter